MDLMSQKRLSWGSHGSFRRNDAQTDSRDGLLAFRTEAGETPVEVPRQEVLLTTAPTLTAQVPGQIRPDVLSGCPSPLRHPGAV